AASGEKPAGRRRAALPLARRGVTAIGALVAAAVLLEEFRFLGRGVAAEHDVAVREAVEHADQVAMLGGIVEIHARRFLERLGGGDGEFGKKKDGKVLIGEILAVLE